VNLSKKTKVVQNNPAMLQTVIQQISAMSPEMLEAIQSNPAAFLAMLNEVLLRQTAYSLLLSFCFTFGLFLLFVAYCCCACCCSSCRYGSLGGCL
jgi:hypothetical protein